MRIESGAAAILLKHARLPALVLVLLAGAMLLAGCSGSDERGAGPSAAPSAAPTPVTGGDFPTGPAALVAADFQHSADKVDSTGAFLPSNGKPTLVFVDAIW